MILADVNVLIYAFRRDMPQHAVCRQWLVGIVAGEARFGLSPLALSAGSHHDQSARFPDTERDR